MASESPETYWALVFKKRRKRTFVASGRPLRTDLYRTKREAEDEAALDQDDPVEIVRVRVDIVEIP